MHSPGPWFVEPTNERTDGVIYVFVMQDGMRRSVCKLPQGGAGEDNANLIAQAPDLLTERDTLRKRVKELEAFQRSVSEAINSGDGSYRP